SDLRTAYTPPVSNWRDVKAKARVADPTSDDRDRVERQARMRGVMLTSVRWADIRAEEVAAGKEQLLAEVLGHRLAEVRRARGLTQQQVAERMGVSKGRVSQIEQGKVSGQDVVARFAAALGGRLHQAIYFDDGDIAAIA